MEITIFGLQLHSLKGYLYLYQRKQKRDYQNRTWLRKKKEGKAKEKSWKRMRG